MAKPASVVHYTDDPLATRLRQLRGRRGWSQRRVAAAAELSTGSISALEARGTATNPRLETLLALARVYDCQSLEELFGPLPTGQLVVETAHERANEQVG